MAVPLSPLAPITDPMAWSAVPDLCKTESSYWIPDHLNQLMQSFPVHLLLLGSHWSVPLIKQWGQDWEKGWGLPLVILSFVPFWVWPVLVWDQGGNAGSLLLAVTAGGSWGFGPHSCGSPQTGLKPLLGWHISEPCGPNLGTWSTRGNCCSSYLKCLPGYI